MISNFTILAGATRRWRVASGKFSVLSFVGSGINAQLRNLLDLAGALDCFTERHNRAGADKQRQRVNGRSELNRLAAAGFLITQQNVAKCYPQAGSRYQ